MTTLEKPKAQTYLKPGVRCNQNHLIGTEDDIIWHDRTARPKLQASCRFCKLEHNVRHKENKRQRLRDHRASKGHCDYIQLAPYRFLLKYHLTCGHAFLHKKDKMTGPSVGDVVWCVRCDAGSVIAPRKEAS